MERLKSEPRKIDRTYSELITLPTFEERLKYLQLKGKELDSPRAISRSFYKSKAWLDFRDRIITRDLGLDLATRWVYIYGPIYVHHMVPITEEDILEYRPILFDKERVITTSMQTHSLIHYARQEPEPLVERTPNDTTPWKGGLL